MQHKHFTLIELLVVIAVITILAGLLLPALGQAKKMAAGTMCFNNEKNLFLAFTYYVDAYQNSPGPSSGDGLKGWFKIFRSDFLTGEAGRKVFLCQQHKDYKPFSTGSNYSYNLRCQEHAKKYSPLKLCKKPSTIVNFASSIVKSPGANSSFNISVGYENAKVHAGIWHNKKSTNAVYLDGHTETVPIIGTTVVNNGPAGEFAGKNFFVGEVWNDDGYKW